MRTLLFTIVSLVASTALAQEKSVSLFKTTDANGDRWEHRIAPETLARTPDWTLGLQDPPITVTVASHIAMAAGKRRLPRTDLAVNGVNLLQRGFSGRIRWYYAFQLYAVGGELPLGQSSFWIIVLLDGTVVEPSAANEI
jgi:hypothetical protein